MGREGRGGDNNNNNANTNANGTSTSTSTSTGNTGQDNGRDKGEMTTPTAPDPSTTSNCSWGGWYILVMTGRGGPMRDNDNAMGC